MDIYNSKESNSKKKITILILGSEASTKQIIKIQLKQFSKEVLIANSNQEAFEILNEKKIDLLFLDTDIRDIEQMELIKELKINFPQVLFILLMTDIDKDTAIKALKLDVFDVIEKPLKKNTIINCITSAIYHLKTKESSSVNNASEKKIEYLELKISEEIQKRKNLQKEISNLKKKLINEAKIKDEIAVKQQENKKSKTEAEPIINKTETNIKKSESETQVKEKIEADQTQKENEVNESNIKDKNLNVENNKLLETIKEKEVIIDKLSNIINQRSKISESKNRDKKILLDQAQKEELSIKKLKTDGKKDALDTQKNEIENSYRQMSEMILESISEISSLLVGIENANLNKDKTIDSGFRKLIQFYEDATKDLNKYQKLYFEEKNDKNGLESVSFTEEDRKSKFKDINKNITSEINLSSNSLKQVQENVSETIEKIEEKINSINSDIKEKREKCSQTEKEWLFLMQDYFKEKYFDLLDIHNKLKLILEEKEVIISSLEKKITNAENLITFLREKNKIGKAA